MADVHNKETRSFNMSRIRNKNTRPELLVRKFLHSKGFRFRLNDKRLPGTPDIVLPKYHTVIFVHGCFWHGHQDCRYFVVPRTRTEWWIEKISINKRRDQENADELIKSGWKVLTIFECKLIKEYRDITLNEIITELH